MITSIQLKSEKKLSKVYTLQGESYPRSESEPDGYTGIRILKDGRVRISGGGLHVYDDALYTPNPVSRRLNNIEFSVGKRNYTLAHLTNSSSSDLTLYYTTPLKLPPGMYNLNSEFLKKELLNAKNRSYNAMKNVGFKTWDDSEAWLFVDSFYDGEKLKYLLTYKFIIADKRIYKLRTQIKKHAEQTDDTKLMSPEPPTPRRLF